MMNLYQRTNPHSWRQLSAITILIVVLFMVDTISGGRLRAFSQYVAGDISHAGNRVFNTIRYSGFFTSRATLAAQNQTLQMQVAQYQEQAAAYQALREENTQLAALAHLAQDTIGTTTPVISSFSSSPYGTFLIGAGSLDGIRTGTLVLTSDAFVIGRVTNVNPRTALVSELFAPGTTIPAIVAENAASFAGEGGGNARSQIPRDITVAIGDVVTSSTVNGRPIGIIGKVDSKPANAYSTVYMRLPQNISSLRYVFVLSNAK